MASIELYASDFQTDFFLNFPHSRILRIFALINIASNKYIMWTSVLTDHNHFGPVRTHDYHAYRCIEYRVTKSCAGFTVGDNTAFRMFMERTRMVRGLPFTAVLPDNRLTRTEAAQAVAALRAEASGMPEMTLDEINAEISAARAERTQTR